MPLHAILFGGFRALAEIDALDHQALDAALQERGEGPLSFADYRQLADIPDGPRRMEQVTDGDGATLFAAKQDLLRERVAEIGLTPRPGVAEVIDAAAARDVPLALVTGTDRGTREAMFGAFGRIVPGTFVTIAPDWAQALDVLGMAAVDCVAVAAAPEEVAAARAAGLAVVGFPGAAQRDRDFSAAATVTATLTAEMLGVDGPA